MRVRLFVSVLLVLSSPSCSDSPAETIVEPCPSDALTVQASAGLTPLFTWQPACGVAFLMVYPAAGGGSLWTVYGDSEGASDNPIPSGVRYGRTPDRGNTVAGPEPLRRGTEYQVQVSRRLCDQGELCILQDVGGVSFRP
jgi:hypothetical protein